MRTPSTKALILIGILSIVGCGILIPEPSSIPIRGPDGKVLIHQAMAESDLWLALVATILFCCFSVCIAWLGARFTYNIYWRIRAGRARRAFEKLHPEIIRKVQANPKA